MEDCNVAFLNWAYLLFITPYSRQTVAFLYTACYSNVQNVSMYAQYTQHFSPYKSAHNCVLTESTQVCVCMCVRVHMHAH
jgi:hypothetical protein